MVRPALILVTGQPGSGKTTLARQLAAELNLPLIAKDTIKESLAPLTSPDTISTETSQALGSAAFDVVFGLLKQGFGAITEASWNPAIAEPLLAVLPQQIVEVHCACDPATSRNRYIKRAPERHWIHADAGRFDDERLWTAETAGPLSINGTPVVVVDTTQPIEAHKLVARIQTELAETMPG